MAGNTVRLHRVLRAPPSRVYAVEMCCLGWQESLAALAKLVEPEIPGQAG